MLHVSAYFAPAYCYGGPPRSIHGLCLALANSGMIVCALTSAANGNIELPDQIVAANAFNGVKVIYLPRAYPKGYFYCPDMKVYLESIINNFDLVHIHGCWNYMSWMAGHICRKNNVPYIVSPRGMLESEAMKVSAFKKKIAYAILEKRQLNGAAWIHATSLKEESSVKALNITPPVSVIPNGVDLPKGESGCDKQLRARFNISDRGFVLLFVGRLHPIKGLNVLCGGLRLAKKSMSHIRLVLVGDGDEEYVNQLKSQFSDLVSSGHLIFAGHLDGEEKADAFMSANAFSLMSQSENFGLAIAEAMSYGLPVILSKGCPWPQVEDWNAGYWIEPDERVVAESICRLGQDMELSKTMGLNAKNHISEYLDWGSVANDVKAVYNKVLSK
ncbi:glycosyltransferase [Mariprofundus erugo]|uniref:glycosyltransferase n=1 Tax=Mariprofundus erugo TaxID=2528639 RepID=UPI0013758BA2|nr:glycosyltransferase [Mariprofundus erugo]